MKKMVHIKYLDKKREEEVNYPSIIFIILFFYFYLSIYNFFILT
uniref:Uncharacterized protein n=1 Tax=Klebsiella pneumoniae TaxID=573 RepID=A0A8B0SU56_KLEPN|nr:hypothetical protein [Klebsiella pneumoniae]